MRAVPAAAALLGALARPAPPDASVAVLHDAGRRAVPSAAGTCRLQVGAMAHDLRVWVDGERMHLAVLGPLGTPRMVLRSDGRGVALQTGPDLLVAAEADAVLGAVGLPDLGDLAGLWVGRLPEGPHLGRALPDGRAWAGQRLGVRDLGLSAIVHPDHGVELLDVGPPGGDSVVSLSRSSSLPSGLPDVVRVHVQDRPTAAATCQWTEKPAPAVAFELDVGDAVPLETVGRALLEPLLPRVP